MSDTKNQQPDLKSMTPEQIEELKQRQQKMMEDQLPYLRVEEEFNRLMASIEKSRFEEMFYKLKYAELMASQMQKPQTVDNESTGNGEEDRNGSSADN